ncbi:MAG: type II toxin-antitoxin system HicA family toxin [Candidatus Parcubacteria bacterium]|nr:type II toxin-antitoxin system HicA family toxin [Candidatus Parcubacteria bacterium]
MSNRWPSSKAGKVFRALIKIGWEIKRHKSSSHIVLEKAGCANYVWAFSNNDELGSKMLSRIAKRTGLKVDDL